MNGNPLRAQKDGTSLSQRPEGRWDTHAPIPETPAPHSPSPLSLTACPCHRHTQDPCQTPCVRGGSPAPSLPPPNPPYLPTPPTPQLHTPPPLPWIDPTHKHSPSQGRLGAPPRHPAGQGQGHGKPMPGLHLRQGQAGPGGRQAGPRGQVPGPPAGRQAFGEGRLAVCLGAPFRLADHFARVNGLQARVLWDRGLSGGACVVWASVLHFR